MNGENHAMKRRRTVIIQTALLLVLIAALAGCQAKTGEISGYETSPRINPPAVIPAEIKNFPAIKDRNPAVPDDYEAVAQNDSLRLYTRKASSAIIIEDLRSGRVFRSSPEDLADNKGTTSAWRRQIELPVQVAFVDPERSQPKNAKVDREAKFSYKPVQDGVRVNYNVANIQLAFDVIYALRGDCMEAIIPEKSIREAGGNGLVSIDMLAFFGATHDGESGYIVYPDGSGALMTFTSPHNEEVQKINSTVYGADASGGQIIASQNLFREQVSMPVYGLVSAPAGNQDLSGYVAMITHGDFDATIGVGRSGKGINYNHVWTTFLFRRQGRFSITGGQPAWLYQPDRITGDRVVRYCFLNGKDAGYVGMGARYRDFLINERGAKRMANTAIGAGDDAAIPGGPARMQLSFFMGIERKTWFLADMVSMTSFAQVGEIVRDLEKAGVRSLDVSLINWNWGLLSNNMPQKFPVDKRLGGEEALIALAGELHGRGQRLYLEDNYVGVPPGAKGVMPYLDAARGVDGLPVGSSEQGYLLNPQVALRSFAMRDMPKMKPLGADGAVLDTAAFLVIPDKNQRYPLSREGFAASYMQLSQMSRKLFGKAAVVGSNIYAVPYADRMESVPVDSTHFDLFDETIPLYQIAAHGLTQYTSYAYNLVSDGRRVFLRQVEYGATPSFLLTENSSAQLFRTEANGLYSSQYSYWKDEVVKQYQAVEKLDPLQTQFITAHAKLAENVYQTTYESGSRVIVNYGAQPYTAGNISVPAQDFVVFQGE